MSEARILKTGDNVTPNEFEFTYTGNHNFKEGASGTIEIELLTSGTFTLLKSTPFKPFDLCLVGGGGNGGNGNGSFGGSGGGGGYVENVFDVPIELNKAYPIVIGGSAGDTTGFGYTAKAGQSGGQSSAGGKGGSGGGGSSYGIATHGGSNGNDGIGGDGRNTSEDGYKGGQGQHTTTRAFGTGKLFAGGGGGGSYGDSGGLGGPGGGGNGGAGANKGSNGVTNTGGGGGGAGYYSGYKGGSGGSGIVILRRRWSSELAINNSYNYNYITNNITTA